MQEIFQEADFDILNSRCKHNTAVKVVLVRNLYAVIAMQTPPPRCVSRPKIRWK